MELNIFVMLIFTVLLLIADIIIFAKIICLFRRNRNETVESVTDKLKP